MRRFLTIIFTLFLASTFVELHSEDRTTTSRGIPHFTWGVDAGGSIDMGGDDMSTVNIDAFFGYKNQMIDIAGIGTGIHIMTSNSSRVFPLYAIFRSSFRNRPSLCFLDMRAGAAFNDVGNESQTRLFLNPAVGFNLAVSRSFKSYITIGYIFNGMSSFGPTDDRTDIHGLDLVNFRFGITF